MIIIVMLSFLRNILLPCFILSAMIIHNGKSADELSRISNVWEKATL